MNIHKLPGIIFFALITCLTGFAQTSFQGIMPGATELTEVERVLGKPVRTLSTSPFDIEYNPPAGIARVVVVYAIASSALDRVAGRSPANPFNKKPVGSSQVGRIEVYFLKPISRPALIKQFKLPQQADSRKTGAEGNLLEYFGGEFLLVLTYATANESSGVSQIGYYSRELFASAAGKEPLDFTNAALSNSSTGRWSGSWTNSNGQSGTSSVNINEQDANTITGDEDGWVIENGRRSGSVLIWEYRNQNNGCRDYSVRWEISSDGKTANGTYKVTDRCEKQTYTGTYLNYRR